MTRRAVMWPMRYASTIAVRKCSPAQIRAWNASSSQALSRL